MACGCISDIDTKFAEFNGKIGRTIVFGQNGNPGYTCVTVDIEKVDPKKRGRPPAMLPTFCPFCGTRYKEESA